MVTSATVPRKDSNGSSSLTQEETSSDSLFSPPSSHYVIKCNVLDQSDKKTQNLATRVKVTVQQPSSLSGHTFDNRTPVMTSSNSFLNAPVPRLNVSSTSTSSMPEFSLSTNSSIEDSDDMNSFEHYRAARQSNASTEFRKNSVDEWIKSEQYYLPRSKSELNTLPTDESPPASATSQIKPVRSKRKFSFRFNEKKISCFLLQDGTSFVSDDDDSNNRLSASTTSSELTKKKKSKAATLYVGSKEKTERTSICLFFSSLRAKDFKSRAANLIRRRTTEATLSEKSLIPSCEDVQSWEQSFEALLRHRCKLKLNGRRN